MKINLIKRLLKTFKDFKEFRRKDRDLNEILNYALERDFYEHSYDGDQKAVISKEIRKEYFDLFRTFVNSNSIHFKEKSKIYSNSMDEMFGVFTFFGRSEDRNDSTFVLSYLPKGISLEISSHSFRGYWDSETGRPDVERKISGKSVYYIKEIGAFTTYKHQNGQFKTDLIVGDKFKYHSGYGANHLVPEIIKKIQTSKFIPKISEEILKDLKGLKIHEDYQTLIYS